MSFRIINSLLIDYGKIRSPCFNYNRRGFSDWFMVYAKFVYTYCFKLIYLLIHCLTLVFGPSEKKRHTHVRTCTVHSMCTYAYTHERTVCNNWRVRLKINFNIQLYYKNNLNGGVNSLSPPISASGAQNVARSTRDTFSHFNLIF